MSVQTRFPDVIVFPDGTIRLVTRAAKYLAYANTNIGRIFSISTANAVPDYLAFDPTIPQMFEDEGMTVKWERQPVGHYRSKRGTSLKTRTPDEPEDDFDRHRARFLGMSLKQYRAQRGYIDFRRQHHRMLREAAESRDRDEHPELDEEA